VRAALDRGEISRPRYDSYVKLRDELRGVAPGG
jgi:putative ribosome biogenesis GTPase RsgA